MVAPVVSVPSTSMGSPSASFTQRRAAASKAAAAGELTALKAF